MAGLPPLAPGRRPQAASRLRRRARSGHEITITSGATEAIFDVVAAVIGPGDEAVVLDPCYDSYEPAVLLQGGRAVHVPLAADFTPDFERIAAAITERTRLVALNYPHNPSGAVLAPGHLEELARVLRGRDIYLLADEVYEHIVFDGRPFQSVLRSPELRARSFVVGSFGKAFHATGWKVGWVVAPAPLTAELRKVHQFVTFSTSTPMQHALADVLEQALEHLQTLSLFYPGQTRRVSRVARGVASASAGGGHVLPTADYSGDFLGGRPGVRASSWRWKRASPSSPFRPCRRHLARNS